MAVPLLWLEHNILFVEKNRRKIRNQSFLAKLARAPVGRRMKDEGKDFDFGPYRGGPCRRLPPGLNPAGKSTCDNSTGPEETAEAILVEFR